MQMKIKMAGIWIMCLLIWIISINEASAFNGTGSAGEEARFGIGYITINATDGTAKIQGFGDKIAYILAAGENFKGWLSQLEYNFFAPEQVDLNLPLNNSYYNFTPDFDWSNTTDTEQFAVSYLFEIWNDSSATNIHFTNYSIAETANTTKTEATINGEDIFYWRVAANDTSKNSSFSELRAITIDTTLPTAFNITSPADASSSTDTTPVLEWDATTDTNLDNYTIELSLNADFSSINQTEVSKTNSLANWSSSLTATTYYWRATAVDKANNQRLSENNRSFTVTASQTITVTVATSEASSGGGTKPYTLNIIAPEGVTIYKEDTITIPLLVVNPSAVSFTGINLRLESTVPEISLALDRYYLPSISARGQEKLQLTITAKGITSGTYGLTIYASIVNPGFSDAFRIFANLIERDSAAKEEVSDRIEFAKQLFTGNPECLDLSEYISEAELALQNNQKDKALSLAENAVEACNKLIAQVDSFSLLTSQAVFLDKIKSQLGSKAFLIVAPQVAALILLISIIIYFRKRKKLKRANRK